jgi:hypothetical protein
MKAKIFVTLVAFSLFCVTLLVADENLFQNPDFQEYPHAKGNIKSLYSPWYTNLKFEIDEGRYGGRALRGRTPETENITNNQLSTTINIPQGGKYLVTINYKADAPVERLRCLRLFKNDEGENDYQVFMQEQPEPGTWGTLMAEFEFSEAKKVVFAFQAQTKHAISIWWDSPSIIRKEE